MIGSFILSLVTVTVLFKNIDIEISLIPYTIIISTISQLGDLFISMLISIFSILILKNEKNK